jgi:hypothetical protein
MRACSLFNSFLLISEILILIDAYINDNMNNNESNDERSMSRGNEKKKYSTNLDTTAFIYKIVSSDNVPINNCQINNYRIERVERIVSNNSHQSNSFLREMPGAG